MGKRRYNVINLNDERFTFDMLETVTETSLHGYGDILDAYERPSQTKICIYSLWKEWFASNNGYCTVISRNSNFFSIAGYVNDKETNERYYCYITPSNNRCWKVIE